MCKQAKNLYYIENQELETNETSATQSLCGPTQHDVAQGLMEQHFI